MAFFGCFRPLLVWWMAAAGQPVRLLSAVLLIIICANTFAAPVYGGQAIPPRHMSFIRAYGTKFLDGTKSFYFAGTNMYYLGPSSLTAMSDLEIDGAFYEWSRIGFRVVRLWGFGHEWDSMTIDSHGGWTLKKEAFARLDLVIAKAKKYDVRVIFPFVNYEDDLTGMQFYVDNTLGRGKDKELFYADSKVWTNFASYMRSIIYHYNPLTGLSYWQDPTIFAWEPANEPHTRDGFETWSATQYAFGEGAGLTIGRGQIVGRLVNQWLCKTASYIKSLDPNHMVTTGEEGYRTNGPYLSNGANWVNNGLKGVDFESNIKCLDVDYLTVHFYPDNWNLPYNNMQYIIDHFAKDRATLAHAYNKPIVMEEYGCCKAWDYRGKRSSVLQAVHKVIEEMGYAGAMTWQVMPWNGLKRDMNYDFTVGEDGGWEILQFAKRMQAKW